MTIVEAARGSSMTMDRAYVNENGQAVCVWEAPDKTAILKLFEQNDVSPESIHKVEEYN